MGRRGEDSPFYFDDERSEEQSTEKHEGWDNRKNHTSIQRSLTVWRDENYLK